MKIAIVGLGKMGYQILVRLLQDKHEVIAFGHHNQALIAAAAAAGASSAQSREDAVAKFGGERVIIWLMIPAEAVETEILAWQKLLPEGSLIVDGGNSRYKYDKERAELLEKSKIHFMDIGTSGGILGLKNGFSMMIGGDQADYEALKPVLDSLIEPNGTYQYFGPNGAGHYVKMVHNAIEYGMMESLAEGYRLLKQGPYPDLDLGAVAKVWQHGSIVESGLNGLAQEILTENPNLDGFSGIVAESGEARWSLELAKSENISMPAIQAAYDVRTASQNGEVSYATKMLAALRNKFGGHDPNPNP